MEKHKIIWIFAVGAIALAAGFCALCAVPQAPVVMTYQTSSAEKQTGTEPPAHSALTTTARTTAVTTVSVTAAVTETQAPPERNINLASESDLQRVPGIGAALAAAIVAYRTELGGFTYRAQLLDISGIGETLLERIMADFEIPDELPPPDVPDMPAPQDVPDLPVVSDPPAEPEILRYNVNTVTREELLTLPDMTEARADAILDLRCRLGEYHGIYEIMLADSISGEYFETVLHVYLYVEGDPYSDVPA